MTVTGRSKNVVVDREAYNRYMREYRRRPEAAERQRQQIATWNKSEHGQRLKRQWHLNRYSITIEEYEQKFEEQGRCCAICKTTSPGKRGWHTDHDHKTGRFRGILCMRCNLGIGYLMDNCAILAESIRYLERNQ